MANMIQLALRSLEFVFTLIIMAIVGNMIASAFAGNPSLINYDMFVAVFGMLTLFYLIAICFRESFTIHKFVPATLDLLNVLFYFCAAVAMAAELGAHSCNNDAYTKSNHITNGAANTKGRCQEAQATTAFLWFAWACFTASLFFTLTQSGGVNMRGPSRPNMSKV